MSNQPSSKGSYDGIVTKRPGEWVAGDGYAVGDDPFNEKGKTESGSDSESSYSNRTRQTARSAYTSRGMDRDRYESSQYGQSRYVANDGYTRDGRSDAYEQSQYAGQYVDGDRGYSRNPPGYAPPKYYGTSDRRRSYDDQDAPDYYEKTRITKYRREPLDQDRGLAPDDGDRDRERARSQDVIRREDRYDREEKSRGRRDSSSSDSGREHNNTPLKKWAATFAGAAVGGMAANRMHGERHTENWVSNLWVEAHTVS
jgi:hypothetical protein